MSKELQRERTKKFYILLKKTITKYFFLLTAYIIPQSDSTLILSEIMFYPQSGPNEFIELYNYSDTESIDLDSFKIKYATSNPDIITDAGEGTIFSKIFCNYTRSDYPIGSGIYDG